MAPTTKNIKKAASSTPSTADDFSQVIRTVWTKYQQELTVRTKLIDCFLVFLLILGAFQFGVCILIGSFPFNAFLAGFISTVGQFVLTAALRLQINPKNNFSHTPERAFGDYLFGSLMLHFLVYHFIN